MENCGYWILSHAMTESNGYSLKKSYIQLMIPNFIGDIKITHMTTAEFIGSTEDLNSK